MCPPRGPVRSPPSSPSGPSSPSASSPPPRSKTAPGPSRAEPRGSQIKEISIFLFCAGVGLFGKVSHNGSSQSKSPHSGPSPWYPQPSHVRRVPKSVTAFRHPFFKNPRGLAPYHFVLDEESTGNGALAAVKRTPNRFVFRGGNESRGSRMPSRVSDPFFLIRKCPFLALIDDFEYFVSPACFFFSNTPPLGAPCGCGFGLTLSTPAYRRRGVSNVSAETTVNVVKLFVFRTVLRPNQNYSLDCPVISSRLSSFSPAASMVLGIGCRPNTRDPKPLVLPLPSPVRI